MMSVVPPVDLCTRALCVPQPCKRLLPASSASVFAAMRAMHRGRCVATTMAALCGSREAKERTRSTSAV